jgi:ankyrin repeat protein
LNVAIYKGDFEIVHALLRAGANPNAPTRSDRATPPIMAFDFHRSCFPDTFPEIFKELLAFGADINSRDGHGETLLLRLFKPRSKAESTPPTAIVRAVLQAGANPNLGDRTGALPLHYAVALGDPALVQLLLQAGANPNAAPPAQTPAEREAHLCNYFHPSYVRARKNKWLRVEHGVRFPYAQPDHAIAKVEHHELRCFRETPWQLATLVAKHQSANLGGWQSRASPLILNVRRVESLLRQNRAWRKLRAFCRLRYQLFNLYELVCTPDRIDVAADLAAATEGLYET